MITPPPADRLPDLPPLWQATLDDAWLEQFVAELASAAEVLSVRIKAAPRRFTQDEPLTLSEACDWLKRGEARGVQVGYRYDGNEWMDTVLRTGAGYRLVRMKVPFDPDPHSGEPHALPGG